MATKSMSCAALLLLAVAGCGGSQPGVVKRAQAGEQGVAEKPYDDPSAEAVARDYGRLHLVTKQPVLVDPQLAMLCVGIWQEHVDEARGRTGPHAHTSIRIYMNDAAIGAFHARTQYPVGSVIVKEKQGLAYKVRDQSPHVPAETADGVGGMIKRAPGYDPDHGDWEYFYFENVAEVEHGKIKSCIDCHRGASQSDYVFGTWANGG